MNLASSQILATCLKKTRLFFERASIFEYFNGNILLREKKNAYAGYLWQASVDCVMVIKKGRKKASVMNPK